MLRHAATPATIGAAIGSVYDLGALSGVVMGVGVAGARTLLEQRRRERDINNNQLYFYYGARELLGDGER